MELEDSTEPAKYVGASALEFGAFRSTTEFGHGSRRVRESCRKYSLQRNGSEMGRVATSELSTRDRLIEAAISVIESDGEVAIRVDRVAELAGFTKPVLYHHFADREAIIAAAQAERFRRSLEIGWRDTSESLLTAKSAEEFLALMRYWIRNFASPDGEERRRFRAEVLGSAISRPVLMESVVEASRVHADLLAQSIAIAQSRGWVVDDVPARDLAQWWVGALNSRLFFEIDRENFSLDNWDAITDRALQSIINLQ